MTLGQSQVNVNNSPKSADLGTKQRLLTINEFAQICRTTPRTIRFYDLQGLLKPAKVDKGNNYRLYKSEQARDFFRIKLFQTFDVPLNQINQNVGKQSEEDFFNKQLNAVKKQIEEKKKELNFLKNIKQFLYSEASPEKFTKIKNIGPFVVFGKYVKNGRYDQIDSEIVALYKVAKKLGVPYTNKEILIYLQPDEYRPKGCEMEITLVCKGQKLPKIQDLPEDYFIRKIEAKKCVVYDYKGPYPYLTFIHKKLFYSNFAKKFDGNPYDLYIYGPLNKKSEFDYLTRVVYPIK